MESPRELFVHELADMLSAEHIIVKMLPELRKEAQHPDVKAAFQEHEAETKAQIKRLEEAFKLLDEKPEETTCHATEGLKKEHEALHEEEPTPEILEMANLLGAAKTEHYEIASYTGLVQMARDLGEREVASLLKETLDEEQAMAKRVTALAKELGKEARATAADNADDDDEEGDDDDSETGSKRSASAVARKSAAAEKQTGAAAKKSDDDDEKSSGGSDGRKSSTSTTKKAAAAH